MYTAPHGLASLDTPILHDRSELRGAAPASSP